MTDSERAERFLDRMEAWAAKDITAEEWKAWVRQELIVQLADTARECEQEARGIWMGRIKIIEERGRMAETNCATIHDAIDAYRAKHPNACKDDGWLDVAIAIIADAAKAKGATQ